MDWRHMYEILSAGKVNYTEFKNLCVWNKPNGKMGTFYRSKHELVFVFKNGKSPHINNFQLGQYGRCRTNVWDYQSASAFSNEENPDGKSDFELHPTVKPVSMIIDAIRDCSKPGGIILDPFIGSGSSIIAAEKADRRCYGIEIEPKYVDVTIARWQQVTGQKAINLNTNLTFNNKGDKYERV
jgi:DNA modification methylase